MVVAFSKHGAPLPVNQAEVDLCASELRAGFERCLSAWCLRPRLAALGQVDFVALQELLVGVSGTEVKQRSQTLVAALHEGDVVQAMQASNAWRELKWRANQLRPPFIIVKPSELQAQI